MCFSFWRGRGPCRISQARLASGFLADRRSIGLMLALTTGGLGREAATTLGQVCGPLVCVHPMVTAFFVLNWLFTRQYNVL